MTDGGDIMYVIIHEDKERWAPLHYKNIKPIYEISTYGFVRNKYTNKQLSICKSEKGYSMVSLMTNNNKQKTFKLHRLVAKTFIPSPINNGSEKLTVNHKDGNKDDNSIYNLEWITFSKNIKHSYDEGLNTPRRGTLNGHSKYDDNVIEYICQMIENGDKTQDIKKSVKDKFSIDITRYLVFDIKHKKTWKHISDKYNIE